MTVFSHIVCEIIMILMVNFVDNLFIQWGSGIGINIAILLMKKLVDDLLMMVYDCR